jgi:hypothetical protein
MDKVYFVMWVEQSRGTPLGKQLHIYCVCNDFEKAVEAKKKCDLEHKGMKGISYVYVMNREDTIDD